MHTHTHTHTHTRAHTHADTRAHTRAHTHADTRAHTRTRTRTRTRARTHAQAVLDEEYMGFAEQAGVSLLRGHTLDWFKVGPFWCACGARAHACEHRAGRHMAGP
jgi:hypothetical protein